MTLNDSCGVAMSETKITPETPRGELPREFTPKQLRQLKPDVFYPSYFYLAAFGLKTARIAIEDYEAGVIDPEEVSFNGRFALYRRRTRGQKALMTIRGREILRCKREGRQPGRYMKALAHRVLEGGAA